MTDQAAAHRQTRLDNLADQPARLQQTTIALYLNKHC